MQRVARLLPLAAEQAEPSPAVKESTLQRIRREPVALRSRSPRRLVPIAFAAVAAAAVIAALFIGYLLADSDGGGLKDENARYAALAEAAANDELGRAVGRGQGTVTVVSAPGLDWAYARVSGLPPLAAGKAYQAWLSRDGKVLEPGEVFTKSEGAVWLKLGGSLADYAFMGFTIEDDDGASQPTQAPFLSIDLTTQARAW
jgi:hypothetical protein